VDRLGARVPYFEWEGVSWGLVLTLEGKYYRPSDKRRITLTRHVSSVRIPAAMNGIYGFRPSYHRIPYEGSANTLEGQDSYPSVLGPLSTDIGGIKLFMQTVIGRRPWLKDPLSLRKPWDEDGYRLIEHGGGKRLTFGILWNDGRVVPQPPVIRALEMTKEAIIAAGHDGTMSFHLSLKLVTQSPEYCSDRLETLQACRNVSNNCEREIQCRLHSVYSSFSD
jgi:Asp-tRNA(Asn)/Glu-tRNA(Gln) amidotransferase A subunit family amidase